MSPAERQRLREHGADLVADWPPLDPAEVDRLAVLLRPGLAGRGRRGQLRAVAVGQAGGDAA